MANKRINELALRTPQTTDLMLIGDPTTGYSYKTTLLSALNLGVPTTRTITINGTTFDLSANRSWSVGTVTSVGLTMPSAFNVASSPVTGSGTIAVTAAGLASQYIRGDGTLADFPGGGGGGGASVSYYLNGSVNQGTLGGVTYYEMNKTPILGAGTNFTTSSNGYIASFLTDASDPALLKIPGGNWNTEFYFAASSGGGTPTYYIELYKYDGTTFTLIASSSSNPDAITGGTSVEQYFTTLAVPETILTATDRLAIRIYVTTAGRTITLHTENSNLCQIITTFTTGLTALNGLTAQVQYFATGSAGTDFNISSSTATHTFNIPTASATNRGLLSTADWTTFNNKVSSIIAGNAITVSNASGNVTVNHADTSGADPGATISGSNVFRSIVLDTYGHVTGLSYSSFLISDLGGTAISSPSNGQVLSYNGTNWVNSSLSGLSIITGSGTTNWVPKFTSASAIGLSNIFDSGSFIGVFTATDNLSGAKLQVSGAATFSGNVGIGTTSPATLLSLAGSASTTFGLSISANGWNDARHRLTIPTSGDTSVWSWNYNGSAIDSASYGTSSISVGNGVLTFSTNTTNTAPTERMRITSGGDVQVTKTTGTLLDIRATNTGGTAELKLNPVNNNNYSLYTSGSTDALQFLRNGSEQMRITNVGNVGLGVTPSAWSTFTAMQIKNASFAGQANFAYMGANYYYDGTNNRYITSDFASRYQQFNGIHQWLTASSGTAGNIITFTGAMTLDASGNLGIGLTSPVARLHAENTSSADPSSLGVTPTTNVFGMSTSPGGMLAGGIGATGGTYVWLQGRNKGGAGVSYPISLNPLGGNVGIGTTAPAAPLQVAATGVGGYGTIGIRGTSAHIGFRTAADAFKGWVGYFDSATHGSDVNLNIVTGYNVSSNIVFKTNGDTGEAMRITSSGNVGIGVNAITSGTKLEIAGNVSIKAGTDAYFQTTDSNNVILRADQQGGTNGKGVRLQYWNGSAWQNCLSIDNVTSGFSNLLLQPSGGNVGIGTASPSQLLDVRSANTSGATGATIRIGSQNNGNSGDEFANLEFYWGDPDAAEVKAKIYTKNVGNVGPGGGGAADLLFATTPAFGSSTERLRITSSGRTLIGTTTDNTVDLLQVAGSVLGRQLIIDGANNSNTAKLNWTRTDQSWGINNETNLRFYTGSGNTTSPATQVLEISTGGAIKTSAPSGGTAQPWKLGNVAAVTPTSPNRTIEVEVNGTTYYIHAKTTNN